MARHAGVEVQLHRNAPAQLARESAEAITRVLGEGSELNAPGDEFRAVGFVEEPHEQNGFSNARVAEEECLFRFHYRESSDRACTVEERSDRREPEPVRVVLHHGQDRPSTGEPGNLGDVVLECDAVDLEPRIEARPVRGVANANRPSRQLVGRSGG